MYTYSIMPLKVEHLKEIAEDVRDQYRRGISSCPLFMMQLAPEGTPAWDKADKQAKKFAMFKRELAEDGVRVGILLQNTLGHRPGLTPSPFVKYISLIDGKNTGVHCPLDPDYLAHMEGQIRRIAEEHPDAIMIDDDFRLTARPSQGCACHLHMAEFNRRAGTSMTREELCAHILSHPDDDPLTGIYLDLQRDSLVEAAKVFRRAVDSVDPTIQGINCTSADYCESVVYTSKEWAGKGNPRIVRLPNGTYVPQSARTISDTMRRVAVTKIKLDREGVDVLLAETDTIPFNRYSKSARYLHTHFTLCFVDGIYGAKHWITRLTAYEPASGKAYRDILAQHYGFYETIHSLVKDGVRMVGANSVVVTQQRHRYSRQPWNYGYENAWASRVLERMGIPFYFSDIPGEANFIEDPVQELLGDEEIGNFFEKSVFLTAEAADNFAKRGFLDKIGAEVSPHEEAHIVSESFDGTSDMTCTKQKDLKRITPTSDKTETLSYNIDVIDGKAKKISPAVTCYENNGRLSVVYCGTPKAIHNYGEGFSFLNESRKSQFVKLLSRAGALPIYYTGDLEMLAHGGYLADGRLLMTFANLCYDPSDTLQVYLEKEPKSIKAVRANGDLEEVGYRLVGNNIYELYEKIEPMYPIVLVIES